MSCGALVSVGGLIEMNNATNVTLSDNTAGGACPRCGGDVKLIDGTFNVADDVISIVRAPRWSVDTLKQLKIALENARRDLEHGRTDAVQDVAKVSPESASLIARALRDPATASAIGIISALITAIGVVLAFMSYQLSANAQQDLDQKIREEVSRVLEQEQRRDGP